MLCCGSPVNVFGGWGHVREVVGEGRGGESIVVVVVSWPGGGDVV